MQLRKKIFMKREANQIRLLKCTHNNEWEFAKKLRNKYFFDPLAINDPSGEPSSVHDLAMEKKLRKKCFG